jgi:acetyl esterase/lipase
MRVAGATPYERQPLTGDSGMTKRIATSRMALAAAVITLLAAACGSTQSPGDTGLSSNPGSGGGFGSGAGAGTGIGGRLEGGQRAVPFTIEPDIADVTYCSLDGVPQEMQQLDIYKASTPGPNPVVLFVHGGAWLAGDKHAERVNPQTGTQLAVDWIKALNKNGITVASANYALAPRYRFPLPIEDLKCAVRFLRANASKYDLDPNRIGAMGGSAGGHLVALLATTDQSAGWDVGQYLDQSSQVQAVVDLFGPTDLALLSQERGIPLRFAFGSEANYSTYSPVDLVSAGDAPTLIVQGEQDPGVPAQQSQEFYDKLQAAGVTSKLVLVKNAGHGFVAVPDSATISPSLSQIQSEILDWFTTYLSG